MATKPPNKSRNNGSASGQLFFEVTLWAAAGKLRGNIDADESKHVVLGLIFLKYIADAFEEKLARLAREKGADSEDRDEYTAYASAASRSLGRNLTAPLGNSRMNLAICGIDANLSVNFHDKNFEDLRRLLFQ